MPLCEEALLADVEPEEDAVAEGPTMLLTMPRVFFEQVMEIVPALAQAVKQMADARDNARSPKGLRGAWPLCRCEDAALEMLRDHVRTETVPERTTLFKTPGSGCTGLTIVLHGTVLVTQSRPEVGSNMEVMEARADGMCTVRRSVRSSGFDPRMPVVLCMVQASPAPLFYSCRPLRRHRPAQVIEEVAYPPGTFFGEAAMAGLGNETHPRLLSAVTTESCVILQLTNADFESVCAEQPSMRHAVDEVVAKWRHMLEPASLARLWLLAPLVSDSRRGTQHAAQLHQLALAGGHAPGEGLETAVVDPLWVLSCTARSKLRPQGSFLWNKRNKEDDLVATVVVSGRVIETVSNSVRSPERVERTGSQPRCSLSLSNRSTFFLVPLAGHSPLPCPLS